MKLFTTSVLNHLDAMDDALKTLPSDDPAVVKLAYGLGAIRADIESFHMRQAVSAISAMTPPEQDELFNAYRHVNGEPS